VNVFRFREVTDMVNSAPALKLTITTSTAGMSGIDDLAGTLEFSEKGDWRLAYRRL
jgi:hypothetical protein